MTFADVDWRWFLAAGVLAVLGRVHHMGKEIDELKRDLKAFRTMPWPSDGTEEDKQIKAAKALAKSMGKKFTIDDGLKLIASIQKARKEIAEAKGNGNGSGAGPA